jgi:hypothetical protein
LIDVKARVPFRCDDLRWETGGIAMAYVDAHDGVFLKLAEWWRGWRRMRQDLADLYQFRGGLELLARDVNLSPEDLRTIAAKWPDRSDLLRRRLSALKLDPELNASDQYCALRDLERVCALCNSKSRCEHDLAEAASSAAWRDYCPNVTTFDALQAQ